MNEKEAQYLYKCRRCGKVDRSTCSGEDSAMTTTVGIVLGIPTTGITLRLFDMHICKDGNYGVTDFIGTEIVETNY